MTGPVGAFRALAPRLAQQPGGPVTFLEDDIMRIYKPQFTDRSTGEKRATLKWYIDFADHRQIRRRMPCDARCRTEKQAKQFGEQVEALVTARMYGREPGPGLAKWLHGLGKATIKKMAEIGLIDGEFAAGTIPLAQHIDDFAKWLKATKAGHGFNRSEVYIRNTMAQINYIVRECGFIYWQDVTKGTVESCLGRLTVGSKTYNLYLGSFKLFATWMMENGKATSSPVAAIKSVRWTKGEERRALTQEEAIALLRTTAAAPEPYYGLTGVERAVLYLTAIETGYRLGELRALTVGSFDLDRASVNLGAEQTKNRTSAEQLIKWARVEQYRAVLAGRDPGAPAWVLPSDNAVMRMFRQDLAAAGIESVDERGIKVVFHSLRYCLATLLDRSGASLKERMRIMRHSDKGSLTLGVYTSLAVLDLRGAIERLPDLPWPAETRQSDQPQAETEAA